MYSRRHWNLNRCYFHFEVWKAHLLLMADNWVQIDIYSKLFIVIGFKLFKAALTSSPTLQQKQRSLFIFSGTVFDTFGKNLHRRLVQRLKLCLAQLLNCITLWLPITCLGNLTPVQHSKLQDSTVVNVPSPVPPATQSPHNPACFHRRVRTV